MTSIASRPRCIASVLAIAFVFIRTVLSSSANIAEHHDHPDGDRRQELHERHAGLLAETAHDAGHAPLCDGVGVVVFTATACRVGLPPLTLVFAMPVIVRR